MREAFAGDDEGGATLEREPLGRLASARRVKRYIRTYLKSRPDLEDGCHAKDIVMAVFEQLQPRGYTITSAAVLGAMEALKTDGYIYETYDDVHFLWNDEAVP